MPTWASIFINVAIGGKLENELQGRTIRKWKRLMGTALRPSLRSITTTAQAGTELP
jgi:hypothetical protein